MLKYFDVSKNPCSVVKQGLMSRRRCIRNEQIRVSISIKSDT